MFSYIWQMFLFAIWSYCIFQCLLKPPWSLCSYLQHNELVSAGTELSKCALAYSRLWRKSIQFLCQPLATIYQNNTALQNDRRSRTDKKICFHSENTPVPTNFKKHFMHLVDVYMLKTQGLQQPTNCDQMSKQVWISTMREKPVSCPLLCLSISIFSASIWFFSWIFKLRVFMVLLLQ